MKTNAAKAKDKAKKRAIAKQQKLARQKIERTMIYNANKIKANQKKIEDDVDKG